MRVLPDIMEKMGLELTDKEQMNLISKLPVDGKPGRWGLALLDCGKASFFFNT